MRQFSFDEMRHVDRFRLTVKRIAVGKNANLFFHDHDFSEIAVILHAGGAQHWCNGKYFPLNDGDVIVLHPGIVHAYNNTSQLGLVNIIYDVDKLPMPWLDGNSLKLFPYMVDRNCLSAEPEKPLIQLGAEELQSINENILHMENELQEKRPGNRIRLFSYFMMIITAIASAGGVTEQKKNTSSAVPALHYLNLHFRKNVSVDFLARLCSMSRTGFFTAFRKLSGYSPIEYQQEKRLILADELLRSSNKTLGEIANECGFCDSNYLSKLFYRKFGISPRKRRSQS